MRDARGVRLTYPFAKRLQQIAREWNTGKNTEKKKNSEPFSERNYPMYVAKATSDIPAAYSETTPGKGTADLYTPDPNDGNPFPDKGQQVLTYPDDRTAPQPWTYSPLNVEITNPFDSEISEHTFFLVIQLRGQWIPLISGGGGGSTFFWGYLEEVLCDYEDTTTCYIASELYRGTPEALTPQRDDGNYDVKDPFGFAARYPDSMLVSETENGALVRVEKLYPGNFWAISAIRIIPDCTGEGGTNNPT